MDTFLTPRFYYFYGKHFKIINYTTPSQQQHDKLKKKKKLLSTNETCLFLWKTHPDLFYQIGREHVALNCDEKKLNSIIYKKSIVCVTDIVE